MSLVISQRKTEYMALVEKVLRETKGLIGGLDQKTLYACIILNNF